MATPGKEFNFGERGDFHKFSRYFDKAIAKSQRDRQGDDRSFKSVKDAGAYLTTDILSRRKEITKNGRQALVMAYGTKGEERTYTLSDLNNMAKAVDKMAGSFDQSRNGVAVPHLVNASLPADKERARRIKNALLFKFSGSMLTFRVTSSGETPNAPSHYVVKVRLEEWDIQVRKGIDKYCNIASDSAVRGRVSFGCTCGRHTFWYRYLATLGHFALEPFEGVFPKIRNPHLKGCCCKHVLKTLMVMQTPQVRARIAAEMQVWAKNQGLASRADHLIDKRKLPKLEEAGNIEVEQAFKDFQRSQKEFRKHTAKPEVKAKAAALRKKQMEQLRQRTVASEAVAAKERELRRQAESDVRKGRLETMKLIATFAKTTGADFKTLLGTSVAGMGGDLAAYTAIAKEEGLL